MSVDDFAPGLSFFFAATTNLFEEVAKFRAARRLYARIMKERFGAKKLESMKLKFHVQTSGAALTAQQPEVNIIRTTIQALARYSVVLSHSMLMPMTRHWHCLRRSP